MAMLITFEESDILKVELNSSFGRIPVTFDGVLANAEQVIECD